MFVEVSVASCGSGKIGHGNLCITSNLRFEDLSARRQSSKEMIGGDVLDWYQRQSCCILDDP